MVLAGNFDEDLESLLVVLQRSLVLTLAVVNTPEVSITHDHVRDARGHEVFGYENLCVRRVHKILCTEKGRFEGYLVDILFSSSLFKNALNLLLKCDLICYSSVCADDQ